jgi:GNAT superfamily N-acetyltransferase
MHDATRHNNISLRAVRRSDWNWIQEWFQDEWLNSALGPIDMAWLKHVLAERDGVELVAERLGNPVAISGVVWKQNNISCHVLTDIAVAPKLRRQGIGRLVLENILQWPGHPKSSEWVAFVAQNNTAAATFFESLGWKKDGVKDLMMRFKWKAL